MKYFKNKIHCILLTYNFASAKNNYESMSCILVSGRSLDDSFTRSASFRRSKQVKAISNLIHGSGVKAMFRSTWAGSAEDLNRAAGQGYPRHSSSRSSSATPPGSTESSPTVKRRGTVSVLLNLSVTRSFGYI